MEKNTIPEKNTEIDQINHLYDECLTYLKIVNHRAYKDGKELCEMAEKFYTKNDSNHAMKKDNEIKASTNNNNDKKVSDNEEYEDPGYETIKDINKDKTKQTKNEFIEPSKMDFTFHNLEPVNKSNDKNLNDYAGYEDLNYKSIRNINRDKNDQTNSEFNDKPKIDFKFENELKSNESINSVTTNRTEPRSERLRKLSQQLPKIIITQSNTSLDAKSGDKIVNTIELSRISRKEPKRRAPANRNPPLFRNKIGFGEKRLVSKCGIENVALISNVPFEKIRLLNDTFHTLINLRWRWIVIGTIVVHFAIWLVFAVFWYIAALAHYDFEPDPPKRSCVTGGKDFVTIFLASVETQTTIGFGDRTIDEECPESIFLFVMQLILGTGLSGVLTCVVYAKLTRPEKMSRDGVGFSKKAVISMRDGRLCLMIRAWDLNYDHIISSEFNAHFVNTHKTKEGEVIRYYARSLTLQQRQFLLWPVVLVHEIDATSPLYRCTAENIANSSFEITISLKGASASMGTFTQSQTSYLPREIVWGHRFPPVVKYDSRKQKYVIDHKKLDTTEPVDTPLCSASELDSTPEENSEPHRSSGTPSSFSEKILSFHLERSSSFRKKDHKS